MFGKILSKTARAAAKARKAKKTADDAARAKADKAAEGLKGSGESLSTKLRKEAKTKAAEAGPKKTGATPGKKKDTPKKAETDRKTASQRKQATTQRKGSIAKRITVSQEDIKQSKDKKALDAYENKVNDMPAGNSKTMLKKMIKAKRDAFEKMQAREKDMAVIKSATAARAKKMKGKVTLSRFDPKKEDKDLNRGGMRKKSYAHGGVGRKYGIVNNLKSKK
jgi:hypothetical protein